MKKLSEIIGDGYIRTEAEEREWNAWTAETKRREILAAKCRYLDALSALYDAACDLEEHGQGDEIPYTSAEIGLLYDDTVYDFDLPATSTERRKLLEGLA